jgi:osmotically-inducible protein OsmY
MNDLDLQRAVVEALAGSPLVHADEVWMQVLDGTVTLRGNVRFESGRDAVERVTRTVPGVARVVNQLDVWLVLSADDVMVRIHDAILGLDRITVRIRDNDVTLTGTLSSAEHRDAALAAAVGTPGVANVHDELTVRAAVA